MIDTVLRILLLFAALVIAFIFGMAIEGAIDNKAMLQLENENKRLIKMLHEEKAKQKKKSEEPKPEVKEVLIYDQRGEGFDALYKPF